MPDKHIQGKQNSCINRVLLLISQQSLKPRSPYSFGESLLAKFGECHFSVHVIVCHRFTQFSVNSDVYTVVQIKRGICDSTLYMVRDIEEQMCYLLIIQEFA